MPRTRSRLALIGARSRSCPRPRRLRRQRTESHPVRQRPPRRRRTVRRRQPDRRRRLHRRLPERTLRRRRHRGRRRDLRRRQHRQRALQRARLWSGARWDRAARLPGELRRLRRLRLRRPVHPDPGRANRNHHPDAHQHTLADADADPAAGELRQRAAAAGRDLQHVARRTARWRPARRAARPSTFAVALASSRPPTDAAVELAYRSSVVSIPGSGSDATVRQRVRFAPPPPMSFTVDDLDYAVEHHQPPPRRPADGPQPLRHRALRRLQRLRRQPTLDDLCAAFSSAAPTRPASSRAAAVSSLSALMSPRGFAMTLCRPVRRCLAAVALLVGAIVIAAIAGPAFGRAKAPAAAPRRRPGRRRHRAATVCSAPARPARAARRLPAVGVQDRRAGVRSPSSSRRRAATRHVGAVTVLLAYRRGVLSLPGEKSAPAVKARVKARPAGAQVFVNDLGYALRVVVSSNEGLPAGPLLDVDLDTCAGAPAAQVADLSCRVESCAQGGGRLA